MLLLRLVHGDVQQLHGLSHLAPHLWLPLASLEWRWREYFFTYITADGEDRLPRQFLLGTDRFECDWF